MYILGVSHHTWWAVLAGVINGGALIYYFRRGPIEVKIWLSNVLIGLFGTICIASLVFPLAGDTRIFAVGCVRGNGLACLLHLVARTALLKHSKTR